MLKRKLIVFYLAWSLLFCGCNIYMTPDYQAKVQASADALDAVVASCPDPVADPNDYCDALGEASRTLKLILDESYGRRP